MKQFRYEAKNGAELVKGILLAENKENAIDKINDMGLMPVEVAEEGEDGERRVVFGGGHNVAGRVDLRTTAIFYRQLGRLLKSGVPILPSMVLVAEQSEGKKLKPILDSLKDHVKQGKSLSEAMTFFPEVFNRFALAMVELGESTGELDESLSRLADSSEKQSTLIKKVKTALAYPALVAGLGVIAFIFLVGYVVPKFTTLFEELGQTLPFLTRCLIFVSDFFRSFGMPIILIAAIAGILFVHGLKNPAMRHWWDGLKLKTPIIGHLIFITEIAVFTRSMESLIRGGVPLLRALKTALPAVSNMAIRESLSVVEKKVEQGASLSDALKGSGTFPVFAIHLLLIGEQTGRLEQSFGDVADWYEQEAMEKTQTAVQFIEPLTILAIGLLLGLVAIGILLPVFSMDAALG